MTDNAITTVLAAERLRAKAVVEKDLGFLDQCLHEQLVYIHATGLRHGKLEWLDYLHNGPTFMVVEFQPMEVSPLGDAVWFTGQLSLNLLRPGDNSPVSARSWASALWVRLETGSWQLRQFQSTRGAA